MTEATSRCLVARIGAAAPDVEARLVQWAGASCLAHCVASDSDGRVSLYLRRKEAKTARAMQSLIRTLTARWCLPLGDLGKGWLELCTEEEFQLAASAAGLAEPAPKVRSEAASTNPRSAAVAGPCAQAEPPQCAIVPQGHAAPYADGVVLHALSPGFDRRAREMYEGLVMAQAAH